MSLRIIIVGAGPSGCYLAQTLRKSLPDSELTIMDRLPVPYGLVRYGVAPDHQGTKTVIKQFARLFERQNVNFLGNICVGEDIGLPDLQQMFDIVVFATGLSQDRIIGDEYSALKNYYGAGQITRLWNSHPDEADFKPSFGKKVIVIGNGNVALDVVRLLAKGPLDFIGSDIDGDELVNDIEEIHLVGRSDASSAKFDPAMMRELAKIDHLNIELADGSPLNENDENKQVLAIKDVLSKATDNKSLKLSLHFGTRVKAPIIADNCLSGIEFLRGSEPVNISCDSVISAIGFSDDGRLKRNELLERALDIENGHLSKGFYAVGWFKRGPQGTIPENRTDAQKVAAKIAADFNNYSEQGQKPGLKALKAFVGDKVTSYEDWQIIDQAERAYAGENRVRRKIKNRSDMMALIRKS